MIEKLKGYKEAVLPTVLPPWIRIAKTQIGVHETRNGETKRIIEYHATTTLKATEDEVAWCSAFVNWVMMKAGIERTHSAAARSWLGWGKRSKYFTKYAVVVLARGNSSWQGHVGFAIDDLGDSIRVLGGNQGNAVSYAIYPKKRVLGYMWPEGFKARSI